MHKRASGAAAWMDRCRKRLFSMVVRVVRASEKVVSARRRRRRMLRLLACRLGGIGSARVRKLCARSEHLERDGAAEAAETAEPWRALVSPVRWGVLLSGHVPRRPCYRYVGPLR